MKNCQGCKIEIDENKTFCSNRCRQKSYRKREKVKRQTKPVETEPVPEYSQEYKAQFAKYSKSKERVDQIEKSLFNLKNKIESIENRNSSVFGQKSMIFKTYGLSIIFAFIAYKVISATFESKRKGLLFFIIFSPVLIGAYFLGQKLQNNNDNEYVKALDDLKPLKSKYFELQNLLIEARESFEIEKTELSQIPKH